MALACSPTALDKPYSRAALPEDSHWPYFRQDGLFGHVCFTQIAINSTLGNDAAYKGKTYRQIVDSIKRKTSMQEVREGIKGMSNLLRI